MIKKTILMLVVVLCSACGHKTNTAIFSSSSDPKEALSFIGATVSGNPIRGSIITGGEYYDFSQELLNLWIKKDAVGLKNLLTKSTVDMYAAAGEIKSLDQWAEGMTVHLLKCKRESPKIFITMIDDMANNQMYLSQKEWFAYPEAPTVGLILYSYDIEKEKLSGRMLYPKKKDGKIQLILGKPKL